MCRRRLDNNLILSVIQCGEFKIHKGAFTPESAAMLLIDHQVGTMDWTHSHDLSLVKPPAFKLAKRSLMRLVDCRILDLCV